jgi:hypothetical protein
MVSKKLDKWHEYMAEPIVICAGLNYLADKEPQILISPLKFRVNPFGGTSIILSGD